MASSGSWNGKTLGNTWEMPLLFLSCNFQQLDKKWRGKYPSTLPDCTQTSSISAPLMAPEFCDLTQIHVVLNNSVLTTLQCKRHLFFSHQQPQYLMMISNLFRKCMVYRLFSQMNILSQKFICKHLALNLELWLSPHDLVLLCATIN